MGSGLTIPFVAAPVAGAGRSTQWARITGEVPQPETNKKCRGRADLFDINQMLTAARSGVSARNYVAANCDAATVDGDKVTITLPFYVWPSSMALNYSLSVNHGEISPGKKMVLSEIDQLVAVTMQQAIVLDYLFEGSLTKKTPAYKRNGEQVQDITAEVDNGQIVVSDEVFCVYRLTGYALGYEHELKMVVTKEDGYKIEDLNNKIVLSWQDENGQAQAQTLAIGDIKGSADAQLDIPDCVNTMLETCENGTLVQSILQINPDGGPPVRIYYSDCNGDVLRVDNG